MKLVWKLLRQHISIPQLVGFFFANLFGMLIVLLGVQFYHDVKPVFTAKDSFLKADYLIMNKRIGMGNTISGRSNHFTGAECDEVAAQDFVKNVGVFTLADYHVHAVMGVQGQRVLSSEIFIESIPDDFVQIADEEWRYDEGSHEVPVILPRSYINMYNFGYAQTHSMPKINDGLVSMIDFELNLRGNGHDENFHGRVVGFSNRLSSILVPQTFMLWSNSYFAPDNQQQPTRLIVEVNNPTDERIAQFLEDKGYEVETEQLDAEKTTYLLKVIVSIVIVIGLIISVLSFYILMLSIYLLVQKNTEKLQNLMLIGYTPRTVAWPYQCLTIVLNAVVLIIAIIAVIILRRYYMSIIESIYPQLADSSILPAVIVGLVIFLVVSLINAFVIHRKMTRLWRANND
jgi:hypothetical protein